MVTIALIFLFGPMVLGAVAQGAVIAFGWRRARHDQFEAIEELGRIGASGEGRTLLRGKLVAVKADDKAEPRVAAETRWLSTTKLWMSNAEPRESDRAKELWLETKSGRVRIDGDILVDAGSRVIFNGVRARDEARPRFGASTRVVDGDDVLALGVAGEGKGDDGSSVNYRSNGVTRTLGPDASSFVRMAAVAKQRWSARRFAVARSGFVMAGAVAGILPGWSAASDYKDRASDVDRLCRDMGRCHIDFRPLARGWATFFVTAVHDSTDCRQSVSCRDWGECSAKDDRCVSLTTADCALTENCIARGHCTPSGTEACVAATDSDCEGSIECYTFGNCHASSGSCEERPGSAPAKIKHSDDECIGTEPCERLGLCSVYNGSCDIGEDDCTKAPQCKALGECSFAGGLIQRCIAETDDECARSEVCHHYGWCTAVDGECFHR